VINRVLTTTFVETYFQKREPPRGVLRMLLNITSTYKIPKFRNQKVENTSRGMYFDFLLRPRRGWVGDKLAGLGDFLLQSGRFSVVQKLIDMGSSI